MARKRTMTSPPPPGEQADATTSVWEEAVAAAAKAEEAVAMAEEAVAAAAKATAKGQAAVAAAQAAVAADCWQLLLAAADGCQLLLAATTCYCWQSAEISSRHEQGQQRPASHRVGKTAKSRATAGGAGAA